MVMADLDTAHSPAVFPISKDTGAQGWTENSPCADSAHKDGFILYLGQRCWFCEILGL